MAEAASKTRAGHGREAMPRAGPPPTPGAAGPGLPDLSRPGIAHPASRSGSRVWR